MARYQIDNLPRPIDFQGSNVIYRILQNAKNLLMCHMGEVPYDRFRGLDPDIYDLPVGLMQTALLPELDRVMMWEPDVLVAEATTTLLEDGSVYIRVILDVNVTEVGDAQE